MRASRLRWLLPAVILVAVVLVPLAAWGQTPAPGEQPEVVRPWTWWLSIPIALAAVGVALLIGLKYVRASSRFFAREEAPEIPARPRAYAGVNAPAYPAPAQAVAQPAPAPAAPAQPEPAAPPEPEAEAEAAQPEPEEQPEPEAEPKPEEQPEPEAEEAAEPEEPSEEEPPAEDAGEDVYERVLKEQLDKGVSPKVAEGRAKAAAHRARQSG